jgi:hypothetical protein
MGGWKVLRLRLSALKKRKFPGDFSFYVFIRRPTMYLMLGFFFLKGNRPNILPVYVQQAK